MGKDKIAFVVQRYGNEVNGGAEYHCRVLSEHMAARYEVDVLTSCAMDYKLWDNYFDEGVENINNVNVHRFKVEKIKNLVRFKELNERMKKNDESITREWVEEKGPYCPSCIQYLKEHGLEYRAVIFVTYTCYLTIMRLKLGLPNSIFMPTAHDEPNIYFPILTYKEYLEYLSDYKYVVLPYDMDFYDGRTSGVLLEGIFVGAVPIAPIKLLEQNKIQGLGYEKITEIPDLISQYEKGDIIVKNDLEKYRYENVSNKMKRFISKQQRMM